MARLLSACGLAALLAGVAPLASALDGSELVQAAVRGQSKEGAVSQTATAEELEANRKYGDYLTLVVRPVHGPEFSIDARSKRPLQDLTAPIAEKLKIPVEAMTIKRNGKPLDKTSTPAKLRMKDGYAIEVFSKTLWAKKLEQDGNATKAAQQEQQIVEEARAKTAAEEKKRKDDAEEAARKEEERKQLARKANGMVSLRFLRDGGGEDVVLTAKKDDPLGSRFKLVLKRMKLSDANFLLRQKRGSPRVIGASETAQKLSLKDGDAILVRAK